MVWIDQDILTVHTADMCTSLYVLLFATLSYTKYEVIEQIHKMQTTKVHAQIWHNLWIHSFSLNFHFLFNAMV